MNRPAIYFRWVVLVGVLVNLSLGIPGIFLPAQLVALFGAPPPSHPIWASFASLLLVLLSLFYIPAALNPFRHRAAAYLTVAARFGGVWFFLAYHGLYPLAGYLDLAFGSVQAILLFLAFRAGEHPMVSA